jgi:hypothetical protein
MQAKRAEREQAIALRCQGLSYSEIQAQVPVSQASTRLSPGDRLWAVGVALYWAEGSKTKDWSQKPRVIFTNMDPKMICLIREWLRSYCSVRVEEDLTYDLYIHPEADIAAAREHWMRELAIESAQLRTYLKRPNPNPRRRNVGRTYHGTMRVAVRRSSHTACRIEGWIEALRNHCGVV